METLLLSKPIVVNTIDDLLRLHEIDDLLRLDEKTIKLEKGIYSKYDTFQLEIDTFKDSCSVIMRCDYMEHIKNIRVDFWFDIETRKILNYELSDSCVYFEQSVWRIKILEKYISDLKDEEFVLKEAFFFHVFSLPTL